MGRWHSSAHLAYQKNAQAATKAALVIEQNILSNIVS